MHNASKSIKEAEKSKAPKVKVSKKMRSYDNEPFFQNKTETAKAFLNEHSIPKELSSKK